MNARRARDEWLCVCDMWRPRRFVNVCTVCVCTRRFSQGKEREGDDEVYLDLTDYAAERQAGRLVPHHFFIVTSAEEISGSLSSDCWL